MVRENYSNASKHFDGEFKILSVEGYVKKKKKLFKKINDKPPYYNKKVEEMLNLMLKTNKNNKLYVNDKLVESNFEYRTTNDFNLEEICNCTSIPEGKYLVLGDNRPISKDSRIIGLVDEKDILGKAVYRIWPITKFGSLNN